MFKLFFVDAINWHFLFIFVSVISSSKLLVESTLNYFCFILNMYFVYYYRSSTHCIYISTFNSDILSFFTKELDCRILVRILDSVLDSALAHSGNEGDIVRKTHLSYKKL